MSVFVIAGILVGSISVSTSVFATYDKNEHNGQSGQSSSNANLYVNSLSFDFENPSTLDSCDAHLPPCIMMNPLNSDDLNQVFIADPALLNTRTLVAVNVNEQDNFPTSDDVFDIFHFPECNIVTLANFNDINGVFIECNAIDIGIIDVTYSFTDPQDDDVQDDDHNDDHGDDHNDDHGDDHNDDHGDDHNDDHGDDTSNNYKNKSRNNGN